MMKEKRLFGLPNDTIEKIRGIFVQYNEIKKVMLYGSRAMGNYRLGSDIDLWIDGETLNITQLLKIESQIDDLLLPWKVDLSLKHKIDNQGLLDHIREYGIEFYGK